MRLAEPFDQATGLRRLFAAEPAFRALGVLGPDSRRNARASVALAEGLSRRGERVLLLDEARAPYNVGGALGLVPRHSLVDAPGQRLSDVAIVAGAGMSLMPAQGGAVTLAGWSEQALLDIIEYWRCEAPEWMILNGAAAQEGPALAMTAAVRVLVLPGSRTHLAETYAVMKSAHHAMPDGVWWVVVDGAEPDAASRLFASLHETAGRFLGLEPAFLGALPRTRAGAGDAAMQGQWADMLSAAPAGAALSFDQYWQRMWLFSRMNVETSMKRAQNVERSHRYG